MTMTIVTNNVPRDVLGAHDLTPAEREQFDYLNWEAIERGEDSASFIRFRGSLYDLGEFEHTTGPNLSGWDGMQVDSFFSAVLIRYVDNERVIVATATT
jgi:hypothetical protein